MTAPGKFSKYAYLKQMTAPGHGLSGAETQCLLTIVNFSKGDGSKAYASYESMMDTHELSERTVRRCMQNLVAKGWLIRTRKGSGRSGMASEYVLNTGHISRVLPESTGHLEHEYRPNETGIPAIWDINTGHQSSTKHRTPEESIGEHTEPQHRNGAVVQEQPREAAAFDWEPATSSIGSADDEPPF